MTNPDLIEKKKDFETAIEDFLNSGKHIDLGFNTNGTNDIPIGGILDIENPFKIFKEVDVEKEKHIPITKISLEEFGEIFAASYIKANLKKVYTKEDMEKCFKESRLTTHPLTASFKHENLASYLKTLSDEK